MHHVRVESSHEARVCQRRPASDLYTQAPGWCSVRSVGVGGCAQSPWRWRRRPLGHWRGLSDSLSVSSSHSWSQQWRWSWVRGSDTHLHWVGRHCIGAAALRHWIGRGHCSHALALARFLATRLRWHGCTMSSEVPFTTAPRHWRRRQHSWNLRIVAALRSAQATPNPTPYSNLGILSLSAGCLRAVNRAHFSRGSLTSCSRSRSRLRRVAPDSRVVVRLSAPDCPRRRPIAL